MLLAWFELSSGTAAYAGKYCIPPGVYVHVPGIACPLQCQISPFRILLQYDVITPCRRF